MSSPFLLFRRRPNCGENCVSKPSTSQTQPACTLVQEINRILEEKEVEWKKELWL
jgi:hypothetical protein